MSARAHGRVVLHAEQLIERAAARAAFAVLVPQAGQVVGDDRAAALAEGADLPRLGVGKAEAGGQDQHPVFVRHAAAGSRPT